jgi:thymidine kinase
MSLKLVLGCMFSGKSTEIMRIINRLDTIDERFLLIKHQIDKRYSSNMVCTHNFIQRKCLSVKYLMPILETDDYKTANHIIIEEAQFFEDLEEFVRQAVDIDRKNVIVAGLDGDSDRNNFGEIHKLLPLCDDVIKLKAFCAECKNGKEGIFSKRIVQEEGQTCVGASNKYKAVCRDCYFFNDDDVEEV